MDGWMDIYFKELPHAEQAGRLQTQAGPDIAV